MPPPIVYNTPAAAGPGVQVPSALPDPVAGVPKVFPSFTLGMDPGDMITGLQSAMVRIEAMGQRGVGVYGIYSGFVFSDGGGLTLRVGDGAACLDAYVQVKTAAGYTGVAIANGNNYIWLGQAGNFSVTTTPTAPAGAQVCLGNAVAASGAQTAYDLSGVLTRPLGGGAERITGDAGMPADTPPANLRFTQRSRTATGDHQFLWDGNAYRYIQPVGVSSPAAIGSNQNDYPVAADIGFLRLQASANFTLSGIAGGIGARRLTIVNVGASNSITLQNDNAASAAANRILFAGGANLGLSANDSATLIYDGITQRWRRSN